MNARTRAAAITRLMQGNAEIERARQRIARESAGEVNCDPERPFAWTAPPPEHAPELADVPFKIVSITIGGVEMDASDLFAGCESKREPKPEPTPRPLQVGDRVRVRPESYTPKLLSGGAHALTGTVTGFGSDLVGVQHDNGIFGLWVEGNLERLFEAKPAPTPPPLAVGDRVRILPPGYAGPPITGTVDKHHVLGMVFVDHDDGGYGMWKTSELTRLDPEPGAEA